ncbi:MAG: pyruvate kinase [Clostridia bacterium]|nr:pyruvate kinase [Clostridia bacterium]
MRKTKIVCTMGPQTMKDGILEKMIHAGMNVARFNFSHDTHETHLKYFHELKRIREKLGVPVAAMLDTRGPEVRTGKLAGGSIQVKKGEELVLSVLPDEGEQGRVPVTFSQFSMEIKPGARVLIDDGLVALEVLETSSQETRCRVLNDGVIAQNKSVNVPDTQFSMPFISQRDQEDILFAIQNGFDFIAASFTRRAKDILDIREIFSREHCTTVNIIAKIENKEGVINIDEIIRVSDGIMVARGDMGVEIPLEDVPVMQKMIIKKVYNAGKQVITATQMLESMMTNSRPTRAEAADIANAIYDGTSATMLSGETAIGQHPVEAVATMARVITRAEADINYASRFVKRGGAPNSDVTNAISHAACAAALNLDAAAIIPVTKSGVTARMISKYRPQCPIIACTTTEGVRRQLNLSWGITPLVIDEVENTDDLFEQAITACVKTGLIADGELVVVTAGAPLGISGTTNLMKVHVAGHILVTGNGITHKKTCSELCVAMNESEALRDFRGGNILVMRQTTNAMLPLIRKASGLVIEDPDPNGHGAIAAMSLDIPVIIGAANATRILKTGAVVTLDADRGAVST